MKSGRNVRENEEESLKQCQTSAKVLTLKLPEDKIPHT